MAVAADLTRDFAEQVVRRLRDAGFQALFAGGCVRDLLLGASPKDFDVATAARPEQVRELFGRRHTLAVGASFGVIVVLPTKAERDAGVQQVEVATFRTEGPYLDGRRPDRVAFADAEADAKRRDFTINGMFLDPLDGQVLDYVGGQSDLTAKVVRAIGDPRERMTEDKLRLLRAVRFTASLGFELDAETFAAVREMAPQLSVVSAERISQEMRRMLVHANRRRAMELCRECGLITEIFPMLASFVGETSRDESEIWNVNLAALEILQQPRFEATLVTLLHGVPCDTGVSAVGEAAGLLRLSNAERDLAVWLEEHLHDIDGIASRPLWFRKRLASHAAIRELLPVKRAIAVAHREAMADVESLEEFLRKTPAAAIDPPALLTGADLIALGLKPGPAFKHILDAVRNAQLDEAIETHDQALNLARRLHASSDTDIT